MTIAPLPSLRAQMLGYQRRLRAGDPLPSMTELAHRAGVHRDTIYALLNGERISIRSRYALSRVMAEVEEETRGMPSTRLMSVCLTPGGASLAFGVVGQQVLAKRR
jgi:hypothetical protein